MCDVGASQPSLAAGSARNQLWDCAWGVSVIR